VSGLAKLHKDFRFLFVEDALNFPPPNQCQAIEYYAFFDRMILQGSSNSF